MKPVMNGGSPASDMLILEAMNPRPDNYEIIKRHIEIQAALDSGEISEKEAVRIFAEAITVNNI